MSEEREHIMKDHTIQTGHKLPPAEGSPLALAGLMWGVGVLDPVEVLRYLDATFRDYRNGEEGQSE
jgi:hypothetical protein